MRFVDTSILLYAISRDEQETDKAQRANELLDGRDISLSVQVLQEFYVQATRTGRADALQPAQAVALVESFTRFPVAVVTAEVMTAAFELSARFRVSYWDAAILESARSIDCDVVLSEDLADGQDYDGVRVENPFARPG